MATSTSITTTYAGEFAGKYISAALLSGDTLNRNLIEVRPNVKFKEVIQKLDTGSLIADASCDFDPTSSVTLTERILQPEEFQVNLQLCKKDFRNTWQSVEMGFSVYDDLPKSFSDYLIAHVAAKIAQKTENTIWGGSNATVGEFDGFTTLFGSDADIIKGNSELGITQAAITSSNVDTMLGAMVDALPDTIRYEDDTYIYVSNSVYTAYLRHLAGYQSGGQGAAGYNNQGHNQSLSNTGLLFDGVKVVRVNGLKNSDMVAAQRSNLFFGTGLLSDHNEVKVIDMEDIDGSQNVRMVMRFTSGVQYGIGSEIAYYTAP